MYVSAHKKGAKQYADVHTTSSLDEENPHRLIQMLMEGFLARVNSAKGAMQHGDMEAKSIFISKAIGIVGGLNEALDFEQGGDLAANLRELYNYMNMRLLHASQENSLEILDEVAGLMKDIKEAWDAIA
ncbi:flagellar export chaperone FliS [Methylomonas rapida]|uniref:Flagellar secretion chaperone FliS n=1 Tax=Methylomonas rapida TaxID=2963939 RepID=A0ABY7GLN2_9GAMM|nr:flagellar export chaperone FliS [Methylomonas rapida]WAR45415.1 flagellar export chaperone FliS [Methylomonas rapida]